MSFALSGGGCGLYLGSFLARYKIQDALFQEVFETVLLGQWAFVFSRLAYTRYLGAWWIILRRNYTALPTRSQLWAFGGEAWGEIVDCWRRGGLGVLISPREIWGVCREV
jgi:hypothetical protein